MEEILNNWLQEKPKDKFDKELQKYTYYDLMEFAEHYHALQLLQTGVSGRFLIQIKQGLDNWKWYANKAGETFEVKQDDGSKQMWRRLDVDYPSSILKSDVVVLKNLR